MLNKLSRKEPTKFQRIFGMTQKKKELDAYFTVRNFRTFFEDYTDKFQIVHDFIELHVNFVLKKKFGQTYRIFYHKLFNRIIHLNRPKQKLIKSL